jgi:hypothetical protein
MVEPPDNEAVNNSVRVIKLKMNHVSGKCGKVQNPLWMVAAPNTFALR